jgi:hypothetical protein
MRYSCQECMSYADYAFVAKSFEDTSRLLAEGHVCLDAMGRDSRRRLKGLCHMAYQKERNVFHIQG